MNLSSMSNFLKFFIITTIAISIYPLKGYSYVTVIEKNCTESEFNLNATLKKMVIAKGICRQSLDILPHEISKQRKDVLFLFFKNDPFRYVLAYSTEEGTLNNIPTLILKLTLDIDSLKKTLINLGIYFDLGTIKCNIETENFDVEDNEILTNLTILSNVQRSNSSESIKLSLKKYKTHIYSGTLEFNNLRWSTTAKSLFSLWEKLWSYYFNQSNLKQRFFKKIYVNVGPWATISGLFKFYNELKNKKELLCSVKLISINFNKGVYGEFDIVTSNYNRVIELLTNLFENRGLEYNIKVATEDGN